MSEEAPLVKDISKNIPKDLDWSETIYPQFVKDGFVTATNVVKSSAQVVGAELDQHYCIIVLTVVPGQGAGAVGGAVAGGVNAVGGAVSNTAGAVTSFVPTPPTFNAAPARWGGSEPSIEERTKADIAGWLEKVKLESLQADFASAEVDGPALAAMVQTWESDKLGFVKYAQENLGCKKPGQAFRLGYSLSRLHAYKWPKKEEPEKPKDEKPQAEAAAESDV
ncbi:hypothetical protein GUITHDRAFT_141436 [Guillardia theta CCMP2712]|uniref:SAM domain-containing protein n=1 Tax=Guillardia theta (strain CCMP2712) TaxID=905079 RepID=L1J283_GUITC|nr:hypothetical protein GUITHDRAFT_141436 [Guillardia theta CCMP2712]EKX42239.1 hypothetical protein GUITHDRAFT_141436 [Guillardia theta CCMP2712]|eukprot:XP_005829219.1 hypothetical protein GUITHDRAFT_141436 [Guillardia theta CCMP2712]